MGPLRNYWIRENFFSLYFSSMDFLCPQRFYTTYRGLIFSGDCDGDKSTQLVLTFGFGPRHLSFDIHYFSLDSYGIAPNDLIAVTQIAFVVWALVAVDTNQTTKIPQIKPNTSYGFRIKRITCGKCTTVYLKLLGGTWLSGSFISRWVHTTRDNPGLLLLWNCNITTASFCC